MFAVVRLTHNVSNWTYIIWTFRTQHTHSVFGTTTEKRQTASITIPLEQNNIPKEYTQLLLLSFVVVVGGEFYSNFRVCFYTIAVHSFHFCLDNNVIKLPTEEILIPSLSPSFLFTLGVFCLITTIKKKRAVCCFFR